MKIQSLNYFNHGDFGNPHKQYDFIGDFMSQYDADNKGYLPLIDFYVTDTPNISNSFLKLFINFKVAVLGNTKINFVNDYSATFLMDTEKDTDDMAIRFSYNSSNLGDGDIDTLGQYGMQIYHKEIDSVKHINHVWLVLYYPFNYKYVRILSPLVVGSTANTDTTDWIGSAAGISAGVPNMSTEELTKLFLDKFQTVFTDLPSEIDSSWVKSIAVSNAAPILNGSYGFKVKTNGIYVTNDGGTTWINIKDKLFS